LVTKITDLVSIPVIAHGGAGKQDHVVDVLKKADVSSAMISSLFHYHFIKENESTASSLEGNVEFLNQKRNFHTFEPCSIEDVKKTLISNHIDCRL
jgi:cyclase